MRIAFVSTLKGSPWGGSEELWTAGCRRALEQQDQALISRYQWDPVPPKVAELGRAGAQLSFRPRRTGKVRRLLPNPKWLRDITSFDPEVVCISQGGAYECAGHRSMRPLRRWLQTSGAAYVNVIQFNSRDAGVGKAAAEHARRLYKNAATNVFVAKENHDLAEARLGITIPREVILVNPVNMSDQSPLPWPTDDGAAHFACVARLEARTKGQDLMLTALAAPPWRDRPWSLDFFGEGPDRARYEQMVMDLGLFGRVQFRGHAHDIRAIWAGHHALLLPSRAEGTPLAMGEAMLLGRPCMVCAVGGCAGWIEDGVEGTISPAPTVEGVAAALDRLWQAKDRWPQMGQAARQRALGKLTPDPGEALLAVLKAAAASKMSTQGNLARA